MMQAQGGDKWSGQPKTRLWLGAATVPVLVLGGLEGCYGKTVAGDVYGSDAVQYLDIARAFEHSDLHSALNPLWSQGYPALLAAVRPIFRAGLEGEWNAIRSLNFAIFVFCWVAFVSFVCEVLRGRNKSAVALFAAVCTFVTAQVCMDQVSRVGPDQLVAVFFFLVCTLLMKTRREPGFGISAALGLTLGLGFLAKAIFLPLGCIALLILTICVCRSRARLAVILPALALFCGIVFGYGVTLSHAVGSPTLGEAGSMNYAWHVNRLAKWVHWEGGTDTPDKAWPKPWMAHFTRWHSDPPDFGRPLHPSQIVGTAPTVYVFHAPVQATYVPYFDPPYWYAGYHHIVRWRFQVVALGKNLIDLAHVLVVQPLFWALCVVWLLGRPGKRSLFPDGWPVAVLALAGVAIYIPVHLEGRYLAAFLSVLVVLSLADLVLASATRRKVIVVVLAVGFAVGLVKDQRTVWTRALHGWSYRDNLEWREGAALRAEGLAEREIGVISWTPNVQCDWAYLAGVRITSEIASAADEKAFWQEARPVREATLQRFHDAGAAAVITRDKPDREAGGWRQVSGLPVWIYRF